MTQLDYGEEPVTTVDNPEGTGELYAARDLAVGVSYARALTDRFTIGGTAKLIRQQIYNESANGAAFDLGLRYSTGFRGITIGMAMTNFGSDMTLAGRDLRRRIDIDPGQIWQQRRRSGRARGQRRGQCRWRSTSASRPTPTAPATSR